MKQKQPVWISMTVDGQQLIANEELKSTNTGNLRSKITKFIDAILVAYVTKDGMQIAINIMPAEVDEMANPER